MEISDSVTARENEEGKIWRRLVPGRLQALWRSMSAGRKGCKPQRTNQKKHKSAVGKEIGLIYGGSLILNTIIGPGIFTSPKGVLAGSGSVGMSLVIWGICGVFSTMAALCFAELRESVRKDGVEYAYITEAFGPLAGFVYCWMRIAAAEPVGTAVFAVALADYTADTIYDDCVPPDMLRKSIAILAVVSLALLNVFSQKLAERMQMLASFGKTCALSVIVLYGVMNLVQGQTSELKKGFHDTVTSPTSITFAFYNGLWAYGGWSNVNHVTSGLKKPPRNVPRLVKTIIPLVMVIYGLVVTSYFTVMSREDMLKSEAIGVTWAERTFSGGAIAVIPIGVGLTALGSLNGTFLSAGRLSGVAVKDGQMPEVASWVHVRSKTPILTVYTRLVIAIIMIMVAEINELVRFFIFSVWMFHGLSILALLVLRFKDKHKTRPYKVNIVLPVIVVSIIGFLLIGPFLEEPKAEFISSLVLLALSFLCYLPSHWIQANSSVPDKIIVWLQLFFRIAPKRDLRRKSFLRRMSALAGLAGRNSILIPAGASPATIRRIQESPNLRRRMTMATAAPSLLTANLNSPTIIRRVDRRRSLADVDVKRGRSGSRVQWLDSPNLVKRRPSRQTASFGAADGKLPNLPEIKVIGSSDQETRTSSDTLSSLDCNHHHLPNHHHHHNNHLKPTSGQPNSLSHPAFISTSDLPAGVRSGSLNDISSVFAGTASATGSGGLVLGGSNSPGRQGRKAHGSLPNLLEHGHQTTILPPTPFYYPHFLPSSPIQEESGAELTSPPLSRQNSQSLELIGGFESEGGGEYEILTLPPLFGEGRNQGSGSSSSSSSSSDDDEFRGLGFLFDSSTEYSSGSTSSLNEEGSESDEGEQEGRSYSSEELESEQEGCDNPDDRASSHI